MNEREPAETESGEPQLTPDSQTLAVAAVAFAVMVLLSLWMLPGRLVPWSVALGGAALAIAVSDAARFIVPDRISLPAIPLGLLASGYLAHPGSADLVALDNVVGMALGGLGLWAVGEGYARLRGHQGLGLGDVKLAAAGGAWVGATLLPQVLLLASAAALALVMAAAARRGASVHRHERVPFGAFLAPAIWVVWLLDNSGLMA